MARIVNSGCSDDVLLLSMVLCLLCVLKDATAGFPFITAPFFVCWWQLSGLFASVTADAIP